MCDRNFLIFGRIPPPFGGVTTSVKNLVLAIKEKGLSYDLFSWKSVGRKYELSHVNYSRTWKVLSAAIISKILSEKVLYVIHGNDYRFDNKFNRIILRLFDGIIALNEDVYQKSLKHGLNVRKLTPILRLENITSSVSSNITSVIDRLDGKKYILIYINDEMYIDNKEVYGALFFSRIINRLPSNVVPVVVDINAKFGHIYESAVFNKEVIYFPHPVAFFELLSEVDLYVRPTSNDGSSVAILEAISIGIPVLASDTVDRPQGVSIYRYEDEDDFIDKIDTILSGVVNQKINLELNTLEDILEFADEI